MPLEETKGLCEEKKIFEDLKRGFSLLRNGLGLESTRWWAREELNEVFWDFVGINERKGLE